MPAGNLNFADGHAAAYFKYTYVCADGGTTPSGHGRARNQLGLQRRQNPVTQPCRRSAVRWPAGKIHAKITVPFICISAAFSRRCCCSFAVSGILAEALGIRTPLLRLISTIHTLHDLKSGGGLSSLPLKIFAMIMAVSFIVMTILGVVMALKYGRSRRAVYCCLVFGVMFPLAIILIRALA